MPDFIQMVYILHVDDGDCLDIMSVHSSGEGAMDEMRRLMAERKADYETFVITSMLLDYVGKDNSDIVWAEKADS